MRVNKKFLNKLIAAAGLIVLFICQSCTGAADNTATLTEAYKNLYDAVKSKNTENIKANMSKETVSFALGVAQMQKKTPEEMFKNGLIQSTRSEKLPATRNGRIKDNMGALEVQDTDGTWQDVPFILEDGRWKIAVGDLFKGNYKKPAPSQAETEANNNVPQVMPGMPNMDANTSVNTNPLANKKQIETNKGANKDVNKEANKNEKK